MQKYIKFTTFIRNMIKKSTVDITPDKSLIKKLGLTGYRTEQAIAELIDNSIDARIEHQTEHIEIDLNFEKSQITIRDDGHGMDRNELKNALVIAKETKSTGDKLGRFGLGMKSACSNLGKSFTISTVKQNTLVEFMATYDEDQWMSDKSKNWTNFEIKEVEKRETNQHGTTIIIKKLNIPLYPNQLLNFRKQFGIRYGPYLKNNQIEIRVGAKRCHVIEPELENGTKHTLDINLPNGNKITGWIGLLEKRSIKGDYGFHLYRRERLIKAFDKFGVRNHPEVAKIIGKISLDHVPINFQKTGFLEDSLEYKESVDKFKNDPVVLKILKKSHTKKIDISAIKSIFECELGKIPEKPMDTRLSAANAASLLRKADKFTIQKGLSEICVEFEDAVEYDIYQTHGNNDKKTTGIKINRHSDLFKVFKNPLFLMGLIRIEAEMIINDHSNKYAGFVHERNKRWDEFVNNFLPKPENVKKNKSNEKLTHLVNYSLESELVELHDHLNENFEYDYQFTGLCTLTPFLHNAYKKIIYNIQTLTGAGQNLLEMVSNYTDRFIVLLNPKHLEIETVLNISEKDKIIVIREYSDRLFTTWAMPEKAWLDLYVECNKNKITMYDDELLVILEELFANNLANQKKLRSLAMRKKLLNKIEMYLQSE